MNNLSEANWQMQVAGVKFAANSLAYGVFPELAERAKREADEFSKLPAPKDPSEMALLIAKSSLMQASWSSEFLSRAAIRASEEMLANTQKVVDALLHR
jgi:hypothetical protein